MSPIAMVLVLVAVVAAGGWVVHFLQANNKSQFIKLALAFSGGFLLAIVFEHLLPELYAGNTSNIGIYILAGFLIQLIMEYFSGGINTAISMCTKGSPCRGHCSSPFPSLDH